MSAQSTTPSSSSISSYQPPSTKQNRANKEPKTTTIQPASGQQHKTYETAPKESGALILNYIPSKDGRFM